MEFVEKLSITGLQGGKTKKWWGFIIKKEEEEIDIRYFDESGFSLKPPIPYGWQEKNEGSSVPSMLIYLMRCPKFLPSKHFGHYFRITWGGGDTNLRKIAGYHASHPFQLIVWYTK